MLKFHNKCIQSLEKDLGLLWGRGTYEATCVVLITTCNNIAMYNYFQLFVVKKSVCCLFTMINIVLRPINAGRMNARLVFMLDLLLHIPYIIMLTFQFHDQLSKIQLQNGFGIDKFRSVHVQCICLRSWKCTYIWPVCSKVWATMYVAPLHVVSVLSHLLNRGGAVHFTLNVP